MDVLDELMTVREVATVLRLSRSQVYVLLKRNELPHVRMGKRIAVKKGELVKWVARQTVAEAMTMGSDFFRRP